MQRYAWALFAAFAAFTALAAGAGCSSSRAPATAAPSQAATALTEGATRSADGQALAYRSGGRGETTLLFVHGWCIDQTYWDAAMAAFAPRTRVASLDLVGHGRSGRGRTRWTVAAYARDVEAVIDALDLRRVVLVAHSMSGNVALDVARDRPDRVAAIVAVDTLQDAEAMPPTARQELIGWLRADYPAHGQDFAQRLFLPGATGPAVERVKADVARCPAEGAVATLDELFQHPVVERMAQVRAPVVCINAGLSKADPEGVRKHLTRYEVVSMPGVGHYPMIEDAPRFHVRLDDALRRVDVSLP